MAIATILVSLPVASTLQKAPVTEPITRPAARQDSVGLTYRSRRDSIYALSVKKRAESARTTRILISMRDRTLRMMRGRDTLLTTDVAVPKGTVLRAGENRWVFVTPPSRRAVISKRTNPSWIPPDWHYFEIAASESLRVVRVHAKRVRRLGDGTAIGVRGARVGLFAADGSFSPLSLEQEIVIGDTLYIPPVGTVNRLIEGELGQFSLDIGDGYLIHGSKADSTATGAVTHGCFRLRNEPLKWLFDHTPLGTPVYVF
jgi:hypothetical protein